MDSGRRAIYIEIDEGYYEEACKRVENAQRQERMNFEGGRGALAGDGSEVTGGNVLDLTGGRGYGDDSGE